MFTGGLGRIFSKAYLKHSVSPFPLASDVLWDFRNYSLLDIVLYVLFT